LSARNYGLAVDAYEATLVTPAAFDRFLAGDDGALSQRQQAGLRA
jgi:cytochrome c peroxidase